MSTTSNEWPDDCPEWTKVERAALWMGRACLVVVILNLIAFFADLTDVLSPGLAILAIVLPMQAQQWQSKRILGHAILDLEKRLPEVYLRARHDAFDEFQVLIDKILADRGGHR